MWCFLLSSKVRIQWILSYWKMLAQVKIFIKITLWRLCWASDRIYHSVLQRGQTISQNSQPDSLPTIWPIDQAQEFVLEFLLDQDEKFSAHWCTDQLKIVNLNCNQTASNWCYLDPSGQIETTLPYYREE